MVLEEEGWFHFSMKFQQLFLFSVIIQILWSKNKQKDTESEEMIQMTELYFSYYSNSSRFDNKIVTFEEHRKNEHNLYHYLYFIVWLQVKDETEFTGPESYVANCIKVNF